MHIKLILRLHWKQAQATPSCLLDEFNEPNAYTFAKETKANLEGTLSKFLRQ